MCGTFNLQRIHPSCLCSSHHPIMLKKLVLNIVYRAVDSKVTVSSARIICSGNREVLVLCCKKNDGTEFMCVLGELEYMEVKSNVLI